MIKASSKKVRSRGVEVAGAGLVSVTFTREFALGCSTSSVWHTYELSLPHELSPSTTTEVVMEGLSDEPTSAMIADIGDS